MTEPLPDLWASRDLPVLTAVSRLIEERRPPLTSSAIADAAGVDRAAVIRALTNLAHEHLDVGDASTYDGPDRYVRAITPEGLRTVGRWPNPESAVERLLAALDAQIDAAPAGSPRALRLRALRDSARGVGRDLLVDVMAAVITGQLPS